jgi:hypothetical protein
MERHCIYRCMDGTRRVTSRWRCPRWHTAQSTFATCTPRPTRPQWPQPSRPLGYGARPRRGSLRSSSRTDAGSAGRCARPPTLSSAAPTHPAHTHTGSDMGTNKTLMHTAAWVRLCAPVCLSVYVYGCARARVRVGPYLRRHGWVRMCSYMHLCGPLWSHSLSVYVHGCLAVCALTHLE